MNASENRKPVAGEVTAKDLTAGHPVADAIINGRRSPDDSPGTTSARTRSSSVMQRLRTDPENVERDLVKLVLTLVELVRQLVERQALRRVEGGGLSDDQVEQLGLALMRLDEAMTRLKTHFKLQDSDLNLDLGPLGPLLPED